MDKSESVLNFGTILKLPQGCDIFPCSVNPIGGRIDIPDMLINLLCLYSKVAKMRCCQLLASTASFYKENGGSISGIFALGA